MDAGGESSVNNTAEDTIQETEQSKQSSQEKLTGPIEDDKIEETEVMDADGENSVNNTAEDTIQETEQSKQSSQEKLTGPIEDNKIKETEVMDADGENSVNNTAEDTIQETEQSQEKLHTAPVEDDKVEVTEEMDAGGESSVNNTAEDTIQETEQSKQSIISQMINLKENELDTFAGFLGHNIKVHREFDRLPEDTLQVAKISKILLEMERGNIHLFKGKSLDDIQLDQEEPLEEDKETEATTKDSERDVGGESHAVATAENILETEQSKKGGTEGQTSTGNTVQNMRRERSKQGSKVTRVKVGRTSKKSANRKPWSGAEKEAVRRQLGKYFALDKLPGKHEIETAIRKEPVLCNRPWDHIKFFIKNTKISLSRNAIKNIFST
ncbi:midasin-like isoform X4 [Mercenaria mercenaria]|uniref:midasin-like isoform X4 n=1 Tax=Mercenaria mercenaria TaxID=6596 RepID=UPI00234F1613|nr:midasin-like isoform X4 [Mercenaria mercenaria]